MPKRFNWEGIIFSINCARIIAIKMCKECISTPTSNHAQKLIQYHHKSKCKNQSFNDFKLDVGKYFLERTQKALNIQEKK